MFTLVRVSKFMGGKKLDKNNKPTLYLNYISGEPLAQRARLLNGTLAEGKGIKDGSTYVIKAEKTAVDEEHGDVYDITKVSETSSEQLFNLFSDNLRTVAVPQVRVIKKAEAAAPAASTATVTTEVVTPSVETPAE